MSGPNDTNSAPTPPEAADSAEGLSSSRPPARPFPDDVDMEWSDLGRDENIPAGWLILVVPLAMLAFGLLALLWRWIGSIV